MPISLLALQFPAVVGELQAIAQLERPPDYATQFAFRNPDRAAPPQLTALERRVWEALAPEPRHLSTLVRNASGLDALRRLADAGLATVAGFTPSDALHVLGRQEGWCREAALYAARILAIEERNGRALPQAVTPEAICERTHEHVVRETGRALLDAALGADPGIESKAGRWGVLGDALVEQVVAGRSFSS